MTARPSPEPLLARLWPAGDSTTTPQVYALLDGARDRRIEPLLRMSGREYACLYAGRLSPRLAAAAPYVVHLARNDELTRTLLAGTLGQAWGIFAVAPPESSVTLLRRHFRGLLLVRDEAGRRLVFRFYDPRVLAVYLRTATGEETRRLFGPVSRILFDDPAGGGVLETKAPGGAALGSPPLVIRDAQFPAFREDVESRFLARCLEHLSRRFPAAASRLGADAAQAAGAARARAAKYGLRARREVAQFLALEMEFGPGFELAPGREWALEVLSSPDIPAPSKIHRIEKRRHLLAGAATEVRHA